MTERTKIRGKKLLEEYKKTRDALPYANTYKQHLKLIEKMDKINQKARKLGAWTIWDFEED